MNTRQVRLETRLAEALTTLQWQIDQVLTLLLWGFGILFGGMGFLMGFVLWDRRTTLAPVARKTLLLEDRVERQEQVLKEYSRHESRLAQILKALGIL